MDPLAGTLLEKKSQEELGVLLHKMQKYLYSHVNDEDALHGWLMNAVPDGADLDNCISDADDPAFVIDCLYEFVMTCFRDE